MSSVPVTVPAAPATPVQEPVSAATRKHLRGSSLLFAGRILSVASNLVTQVLIVRYLSKADYGIFAYGLSIVAMGQGVAVLGLDKALPRFLPIYDERGERQKVLGALVLVIGTVLMLGLAVDLFVAGFPDLLGGSVTDQDKGVAVLVIIVLLAPIQALDDVLLGAFAVFSRPMAIFFRKHVLAPGLRLAAVVIVLGSQSGVRTLAAGYVFGAALGVAVYMVVLVRTLRTDGFLSNMRMRALRFPFREMFSFALPLVAIDLLFVVTNTSSILMLGHFWDAREVGEYRVVQPAAHLSLLVMTSFGLLFTPLAARLFARGDTKGIEDLYWRTAIWIAVLSFPVFAATFALSDVLTVALFGARYESSSTIMALLSLGYYFSAVLGFNGLTLRVYGLVRYSVVISVLAAVFNVVANLLLIPPLGALGAAISTCATFVVYNLLKQAGLLKGTGISIMHPGHLRVYGVIALVTAGMWAVVRGLQPGPVAGGALLCVASAAVVAFTRQSMRMGDMFPELGRVPIIRRIVG